MGMKKSFISYRIDPDFTNIFHFKKLRQWHKFLNFNFFLKTSLMNTL